MSFLQQIRETIANQLQSVIPANHKRSYTELTSYSQKNRRISMVGKEIAAQTLTVLKKNKFTSPSEEIIVTVESIILKINDEIIELDFHSNNIDFKQHIDSILHACDETLISRDGYRRLAQVIPDLIRKHAIEKRRNEITKTMNELVPIRIFNIHNTVFNGNDGDNEN
jgi:hypothetical protein